MSTDKILKKYKFYKENKKAEDLSHIEKRPAAFVTGLNDSFHYMNKKILFNQKL